MITTTRQYGRNLFRQVLGILGAEFHERSKAFAPRLRHSVLYPEPQ